MFEFDVTSVDIIKISLNHSYTPAGLETMEVHNWSSKNIETGKARQVPSSKALTTHVMVSNTKRSLYRQLKGTHELPEFSENFLCAREYYHSRTGCRIRPAEFDDNSETEEFEPWLKDNNMMLIDSFTDVNPGEKETMILWNKFFMIRANKFFTEKRYGKALQRFITENRDEIVRKNIRKNFLLQLGTFYKKGLIDNKTVAELQLYLNKICLEN